MAVNRRISFGQQTGGHAAEARQQFMPPLVPNYERNRVGVLPSFFSAMPESLQGLDVLSE